MIVASQGVLYDLDVTELVEVPLGPLTVDDAQRLLGRIVQDPRLSAEPEAVAALARSCCGLPAALRVAGQWVRKYRRRSLSRLVEDLTSELREKGIPMVEAVWDAAYAGLGTEASRLYCLLPQHPGPTVTPAVAAVLLCGGPDRAADALEELESAGLLEDRGDGAYRMHDLLRGHAQRRARQRDLQETEHARRSLIRWYRRQAARADLLAAGPRMTFADLPEPVHPDVCDVEFDGRTEALRWLESQRLALFGCVRSAFDDGRYEDAWALCEPLWTHFLDHAHYADVTDAFRTGVAAADRLEDLPAMIRMRCQLARPLWEQEQYEEAAEQLRQALNASENLGDTEPERKLKASTVEFRGLLKSVRGDWPGAAADFETARGIHEDIGNAYGVLLQTYLLGRTALERADVDEAVRLLDVAHRMASEQERERMTARTGFAFGRALRRAGRTADAEDHVRAALASARKRGSTTDEARVLRELASLVAEKGETDEAERYRSAARLLTERGGGLPGEDQSS